ncbi:MAG TPA: alkaline phosphatase family protein [Thermoanaerobaculia bacterium]|nr:alkaline phosphatase family protein [Thermoanaerobaculia bacterium]
MNKTARRLALACSLLAFATATISTLPACRPPASRVAPGGPKLILFLAVDQMRADYLERFRPLWTGGFKRLLEDGAVFTEARHEHALTETSPGHATLVSGLTPRHHGIVENYWYDRERGATVYSVDDERHGSSPANLLGSTLGDWLKRADPFSRVWSVAGKDRAAVLMGGERADGAFWYDRRKGKMTTSTYYRRGKPAWLDDKELTGFTRRLFGAEWQPSPRTAAVLADPQARARFGILEAEQGDFPDRFPHVGGDLTPVADASFYGSIYGSPFLDELVGLAAARLLVAEKLGKDEHPDVLFVSFSAPDTVGHTFGPASPELLDTLLRLDEVLGRFLATAEQEVGRDNLLISLSADHGVLPLPEVDAHLGGNARRIDSAGLLCYQTIGRQLSCPECISAYWTLDDATLRARGLERGAFEREVARLVAGCAEVEKVWTRSELEPGDGPADAMGRLYAASFYPDRSPDLLIQWREGYLPTRSIGTTHGTPWDYDRHVPWIVVSPGGKAGQVVERVATVDVAPTLAKLAGIPVPGDRDGRDRSGLIQP